MDNVGSQQQPSRGDARGRQSTAVPVPGCSGPGRREEPRLIGY